MIEFWAAGAHFSYLYTEDFRIAQEMKKEFGECSIYLRNAYLFGWQFRIPDRIIPLMKRRFGLAEANVPENLEQKIGEK